MGCHALQVICGSRHVCRYCSPGLYCGDEREPIFDGHEESGIIDMDAHRLVHLLCLPVPRTPGWHAGATRDATAAPPVIVARCAGGHAGGAPEAGINKVPAALRGQLLPAHRVSHADSQHPARERVFPYQQLCTAGSQEGPTLT